MNKLWIKLVVLLAFVASAQAAEKWNMPTPYGDTVHHTQNVKTFAADIGNKTNKNLTIVVHSGASLFKHPEIYRAVRTGQVPIGELFMGLLGNENAVFKADNIPFMASSFSEARKLWKATKPYVEQHLRKDGLMLLYAVPWPPQGFYTKAPIGSVKDLQGLKMRAYSPTTSRLATLLKSVPTTVQTPEIPQAFSTGIIQAMVTSPSTGVSSQAWDFVSYYADTQAWIPKNMVVVNVKSFRRLSKKHQEAILAAASNAEARGWELAEKETAAKTQVLRDNGMKVSAPSKKFQRELKAIGSIMADEWAKELEVGESILDEIR
jgi:TRAP-type C4-dicarboxylate transport system substrate-binding protein